MIDNNINKDRIPQIRLVDHSSIRQILNSRPTVYKFLKFQKNKISMDVFIFFII